MTNPEPREVDFLCCSGLFLSKNSLKNSSKGDPGGNWGISGVLPVAFLVTEVVEIFTTAGNNFWAKSAKLSGADRAIELFAKKTQNIATIRKFKL